MRRILLTLIVALTTTISYSQTDLRLFNHLSVGLNVGTTGIGADIAMPVTRFFDVEAGVHIMPKIKYNTNLHLNLPTSAINTNTYLPQPINIDNVPIQGKIKMLNGSVLINFYPIPISSFHVTVGAFFGGEDVAEVYNTIDGQLIPVTQANEFIKANNFPDDYLIGLKLGDYLLTPDAQGNVRATLKTKNFKPYVGIGIGRAVPKRRVNFKFDLGAMFWGSPEVVDHNGVSLTKQDWDGKDGGAFKVISKIKVYPVLKFRVSGRIF
jgi:hypothetical protein